MTQQPSLSSTAQFPSSGSPASSARFSRTAVIAAVAAVLALVGIFAWVWKDGEPVGIDKRSPASSADLALVPAEKVIEYRTIRARLNNLRQQEQGLLAQYQEDYPLVRNVRVQIKATEKAMKQIETGYPKLLGMDAAEVTATNSPDLALVPSEKVIDYKTISTRLNNLRQLEQGLLAQYQEDYPLVRNVRDQIKATEEAVKQIETANPNLRGMNATKATGTSNPSLGANVNSDQRASEAFARRYGLSPSVAPRPGPVTDSPEAAFARRYGLAPPAPSPEANATFTVGSNGTAPLSYQWYFGTNKPTGITTRGPEGLVITKLTPLYLNLTLESVTLSDSGLRYVIGVQSEAAAEPRKRGKRQFYCSLNNSGPQEIFTLREVNAPPDNPTNATVVLELKDSGERATISKDHPFQRVDGYAADLSYEPEKKNWINRRVGSALRLAGDEAQIIAITRMEVLMGVKSNGKTWAIEYKGAPADPSRPPESDAAPKQP